MKSGFISVLILAVFTISCLVSWNSGQLQCRDENDNPVDWYVLYKIPKIKGSSNPLVGSGQAYVYITSDAESDTWKLSASSVKSSNSMPGYTLSPLYTPGSDTLYITYNDQPPNGSTSFTAGHTKGVVMANENGGFWLIHSVPHYPPEPRDGAYSYPKTGLKNGQSYLCISLPPKDLESVGIQLMYNNPKICSNYSSKTLEGLYPNLTLASWGKEVRKAPWQNEVKLLSSKGVQFLSFAKTAKFKKDLYKDWVASTLPADLLVETWPNGPGRLNSSCHTNYKVENIDTVEVAPVDHAFKSNKDHSKWAIAFNKEDPWICIGDINRAESQTRRGGGTVCTKDIKVWSAYYSSIVNIEVCPAQKGYIRRMYDKVKSYITKIFTI